MIHSPGHRSGIDRLLAQLERLLYRAGWPFRFARAIGIGPQVRTTRYLIPISPRISRTQPLTNAYASDFHAGPTTDPTLLRAACAAGRRRARTFFGHTHGGQLALPGGVPIVMPHGRLSRRYARGRFDLGAGRTLVVSVGLGCVVLPFRLFADSEIVVCNLMVTG